MENVLTPETGSGAAKCQTHGPLCPHPSKCTPIMPSQPTILECTAAYKNILRALISRIEIDMEKQPKDGPVWDALYQYHKDSVFLMEEFVHTQSLIEDGVI